MQQVKMQFKLIIINFHSWTQTHFVATKIVWLKSKALDNLALI